MLLVKILLTIATLGYSLSPAYFDSNDTHATNPSWPGHARFHLVWQISAYVYVALIALVLIWTSGEETFQLWLASGLGAAIYTGFWSATLARRIYGGRLVDEAKPVPDIVWKLGKRSFRTEANVTMFVPMSALILLSMALLAAP